LPLPEVDHAIMKAYRESSHATELNSRARALAGACPGSVNVDMDTLADYAGGYGFEYRTTPDPVYVNGLTRFLELFTRHQIKATLFVIARDARVPEHAAILKRAVSEGHEIANHTLTHPRRLAALSDEERRHEIHEAHAVLSDLAGRPVVGFRAPCYDVCPRTLDCLRELGYRYDSSVHPSMIAPVIDAAVILKSRFRKREVRRGSYLQMLASLRPYYPGAKAPWRGARTTERAGLLELPLSALPWSRVPFYGTWAQMTGMALFRKSLAWLRRFDAPLNYHFHAVELVGLTDADLDARFRVHPGMARPVAEKLTAVDEMLGTFNSQYELMTLERLAALYQAKLAETCPRTQGVPVPS